MESYQLPELIDPNSSPATVTIDLIFGIGAFNFIWSTSAVTSSTGKFFTLKVMETVSRPLLNLIISS